MKARIFGALFVLVILAVVFIFTQDVNIPTGNNEPAQVQSPAPSALDNDMKSLKIN